MALNEVTAFFEPVKANARPAIENGLKDALKLLFASSPSAKRYADVPKEDFQNCLRKIFTDLQVPYPLDKEQEKEILRQLQINSVDGNIEDDMFVDLWKYWLRKDTRRVKALIIIDMQNDFIGGSLAVNKAEETIPVINTIFEKFSSKFDVVIYTKDWHPKNHISFFENWRNWPLDSSLHERKDSIKMFDKVLFDLGDSKKPYEQVLWPVHCVQNSVGAEIHKDLRQPQATDIVFEKGTEVDRDYYSALWCSDYSRHTSFFSTLLSKGVTDIFACGLALDYCVKCTVRDLAKQGFKAYLIKDTSRSVDPSAEEQTIKILKDLNVCVIQSTELPDHL